MNAIAKIVGRTADACRRHVREVLIAIVTTTIGGLLTNFVWQRATRQDAPPAADAGPRASPAARYLPDARPEADVAGDDQGPRGAASPQPDRSGSRGRATPEHAASLDAKQPALSEPAPERPSTPDNASTYVRQDLVGAPGAVELLTPGMDAGTRVRFESYLSTAEARLPKPAPYVLSIHVLGPRMNETQECNRAPTVDIRYSLRRRDGARHEVRGELSGAGCLDRSLDVPKQERDAERNAASALIDELQRYFSNDDTKGGRET